MNNIMLKKYLVKLVMFRKTKENYLGMKKYFAFS